MSWFDGLSSDYSGDSGASTVSADSPSFSASDYNYGPAASGGGAGFGTPSMGDAASAGASTVDPSSGGYDSGSGSGFSDVLGALGAAGGSGGGGGGGGYSGPNAIQSPSLNADGTFNAGKDSQVASAAAQQSPLAKASIWTQVAKGLGLTNTKGEVDLSNPATLSKLLKLGINGGGALNALLGGNTPKGYQTPQQMQAALAGPYNNFNPQQQQWANNYFNTPARVGTNRPTYAAAAMPSSIVASRGFAVGGQVDSSGQPIDGEGDSTGDDQAFRHGGLAYAGGGPLSLVRGQGGGQSDDVHARLSPGEYVFDADTVASLGDGNNDHGAKMLDQLREKIRQHKRSAPSDQIPPTSKPPEQYLPRGALSQMNGADRG